MGNNIKIPKGYVRLNVTRPSLAIESYYRKQLLNMVDDMGRSVKYWAISAYKPLAAGDGITDASPNQQYNALSKQLEELSKRWQSRFNESSDRLAKMFAKKSARHVLTSFEKMLKSVGFGIKFQLSPSEKLSLKASIGENVELIKSIPEQYMRQVSGSVMRAVAKGGGLKQLTDEIEHRTGITRRRAILIANDQTSKANANLVKLRQAEIGIKQAVWKHSHAGHNPRPDHVDFDGHIYNPATGALISGEYIQPGELINCRCYSIPIISVRHLERLKSQGKIVQ